MERRDESDGRNKRRTLMLMYLREGDNWNEAVGGWSVLLEVRPLFGFVAAFHLVYRIIQVPERKRWEC